MQAKGVTVIFYNVNHGFMIYQRDDGKGKTIPYPNEWSFFGGTIERGETSLGCVAREMREELELEIEPSNCRQLMSYKHDGGLDIVFVYPLSGKEEFELHEGKAVAWRSLSELRDMRLAWHQGQILEYLENLSG